MSVILKGFNPFIMLKEFIVGFLYMPVDIWNWFQYISILKFVKDDPIFKEYNLEISPLGVIYLLWDFQEDFFEADEITQKEYILYKLADLFRWMQSNDLGHILNFNQKRIPYKDIYGNTHLSPTVLFYFTFKTFYLKTWRVITLLTLITTLILIFNK